MTNKRLLSVLVLLFVSAYAIAQSGKLSGRVSDIDTKEALIGVSITITSGDQVKAKVSTDLNGDYMTGPLTPGSYEVKFTYIGFQERKVSGVVINFEKTSRLDVKLTSSTKTAVTTDVVYKKPLIDKDGTSNGGTVDKQFIKNMGSRDITTAIVTVTPGAYTSGRGGINLKGARTSDNAVFINGVRQFGTSSPPAETIEEVAIITGGIPAQYGDALGGIISYTTKNAASKLSGSLQAESSSPFDGYNYNLLSGSISGPLLKSKEYTNASGAIIAPRTTVGFFSALQFTSLSENDPSPYGYTRLTKDSADALQRSPVVAVQGGSFASRANFFNGSAFEKKDARLNNNSFSLVYNGNFDFQPSENVLITLGGQFNFSQGKNTSYLNLFNTGNNSISRNLNYNVFTRLRVNFPNSGENSTIKNAFFQLQADFSQSTSSNFDATHKDNVSRYNYAGKFVPTFADVSASGNRVLTKIDVDGGAAATPTTLTGNYILANQQTGFIYNPGGYNTDYENWNNSVLKLRPQLLQNGFNVFNLNQLAGVGFGINGSGLPNVGQDIQSTNIVDGTSTFSNRGVTSSGYSKSLTSQIRLTGQAAAEIFKHTIKVGFEFERRSIAGYSWDVAGNSNIWGRGRALVNRQFQTTLGARTVSTVGGVTRVDLAPVLLLDANKKIIGQSDFDKNLRAKLGLTDADKNRLIFIDSLSPDLITRDLFSVSDIFAGGANPIASYSGYDPYGNFSTKSVSFNDFFLDTINRPVGAWNPIYVAGFIEDKFELRDVTVRLGLRVDAFNTNQQVLRDQWSLTRLTTAGETDFSKFKNAPSRPAGIGDDAAIYVNTSSEKFDGTNQDNFVIKGYREGNRFFDASGVETGNARDLEENGVLNPWFNINGIKNDPIQKQLYDRAKITTDAFTSYKSQVNVLPRVAFSFPISEQSLFYAHYDVLTQRPLNFGAGSNFANPYSYYALGQLGNTVNSVVNGAQYIVNPNLKPQKKIDYEIGFQQALTSASSLKITAAYSELRDLIAIVRVNGAYPSTYNTDGNQDFNTVKSLSFQYELRKTDNITFQASYALQFAETSASGFAGAQLNNTRNATLRNTTPASYDSRNGLKGNIDLRLYDNEGPRVFGYRLFQNAGINFNGLAFSGTPYTRIQSNYAAAIVEGQQNASRLPWNTRFDMRINKEFKFKAKEGERSTRSLNVYMYITNVFNQTNVLSVYSRTGETKDDGFLASDLGKTLLNQTAGSGNVSPQTLAYYYNLSLMNPNLISPPRWIRVGVSYSF